MQHGELSITPVHKLLCTKMFNSGSFCAVNILSLSTCSNTRCAAMHAEHIATQRHTA